MNPNRNNIGSNDKLFNKNDFSENKLKLKEKNKNDIIINNLWNKRVKKFNLNNPALNDEYKCSDEKNEKKIINIENLDEHKETIISEEEKIQTQSGNNCINKMKITENDEELQDMEFNEAINQDKRSLFRIFFLFPFK